MVSTQQSTKASTAGTDAAGPSEAVLVPGLPSDHEDNPTPLRVRRHRAAPLEVYSPSEVIANPQDSPATKLSEKDLDNISLEHGISRDALLLPTESQRAYNPPRGVRCMESISLYRWRRATTK